MSEERSTRIVVNGQEYHSVEEMPPDVRSLYERALALAAAEEARDTPAAGEVAASPAGDAGSHVSVRSVVTTTKFVVNGKEYTSIEELPPEVAGKVREAMASAGSEALPGAMPRPQVTRAPAGTRIPSFEPKERLHVRVRVSALRLVLWVVAILLIILLYLRRH